MQRIIATNHGLVPMTGRVTKRSPVKQGKLRPVQQTDKQPKFPAIPKPVATKYGRCPRCPGRRVRRQMGFGSGRPNLGGRWHFTCSNRRNGCQYFQPLAEDPMPAPPPKSPWKQSAQCPRCRSKLVELPVDVFRFNEVYLQCTNDKCGYKANKTAQKQTIRPVASTSSNSNINSSEMPPRTPAKLAVGGVVQPGTSKRTSSKPGPDTKARPSPQRQRREETTALAGLAQNLATAPLKDLAASSAPSATGPEQKADVTELERNGDGHQQGDEAEFGVFSLEDERELIRITDRIAAAGCARSQTLPSRPPTQPVRMVMGHTPGPRASGGRRGLNASETARLRLHLRLH